MTNTFLIPAVITQIFHHTAYLSLPTGASTNEAKVEMEIHPLTAKSKTRKYSE